MKISVEKLELKKKVNKNSERNLSSKLQREFLHEKNLVEKKKKIIYPDIESTDMSQKNIQEVWSKSRFHQTKRHN